MTGIEIQLNTGDIITVQTDNYNAQEMAKALNSPGLMFMTVGDTILHKQTVKLIRPLPTATESGE